MKLEGQQREKHVGQQVGLHLPSAACKEGKNVMFITRLIMLKPCNPHRQREHLQLRPAQQQPGFNEVLTSHG